MDKPRDQKWLLGMAHFFVCITSRGELQATAGSEFELPQQNFYSTPDRRTYCKEHYRASAVECQLMVGSRLLLTHS